MSDKISFKYYDSFMISADVFDVPEPKDYPALYGGIIDFGDGRVSVLDYVILKSKDDYESLVDSLKREHNRIREHPIRRQVDKSYMSNDMSYVVSDMLDNVRETLLSGLGDLNLKNDLKKHVSEFSSYLDDEDVEIVKAGWQLAVKRYAKDLRTAGVVGYDEWVGYSGLGKKISEEINAYLWDMAFVRRRFDLYELVKELVEEFGLDEKQAELIVRTEFANIFNKMREWAYLEKTDVKKFVWVVKSEACEKCRKVHEESKAGVSLDVIKGLIREYGKEYAREWSVHPNCRCAVIAKRRSSRRSWESV